MQTQHASRWAAAGRGAGRHISSFPLIRQPHRGGYPRELADIRSTVHTSGGAARQKGQAHSTGATPRAHLAADGGAQLAQVGLRAVTDGLCQGGLRDHGAAGKRERVQQERWSLDQEEHWCLALSTVNIHH